MKTRILLLVLFVTMLVLAVPGVASAGFSDGHDRVIRLGPALLGFSDGHD